MLGAIAYLLVALVLFAAGARLRFALPLEPIIDGDVYGYLGPALFALSGKPFVHLNALNFLYPGALFLLLKIFGDLRAITIAQHLLGIAAGGLLLVAWNRVHLLLPASRVSAPAHRAIGLVGAGIYLLSNTPILLEHTVRSDGVCIFFAMLTTALLVEFLYYRLLSSNHRKAMFFGLGAIAAAGALASLKPSFILTALLFVSPIVWLIGNASCGVQQKTAFFLALLLIAALLIVPERLLQRTDWLAKEFLPASVFSVHANIIRRQMEADLASNATAPYAREWLQGAHDDLVAAIQQRDPRFPPFPSLGYNPDYLRNLQEGSMFDRWERQLGSSAAVFHFLRHSVHRAVLHRPLEFVAKTGRELAIFYRLQCPAFPVNENVPLSPYYCESLQVLLHAEVAEIFRIFDPRGSYRARVHSWCGKRITVHEPEVVKRSDRLLGRSYFALLILSSALAFLVISSSAFSPEQKRAGLLVLLFWAGNFANTFALALLHTMDVDRYSYVQFLMALFAVFCAARWLAGFPIRRIKAARSNLP